ncbi:MAG TPA: prenyltransferase/squalene oxidase repeat-containing protein [Bryobacteraceae bacterium]|nr:prenyltransferase/squalene oxidase repeat-containing protein [Bryobacteraceae bacterium]
MQGEIDIRGLEDIRSAQNPDGGWPYRKGGSWTEPTVYALLAHQATRRPASRGAEAVAWLSSAQRSDGGWTPRHSVDQSTWVTALVALLPPETIGEKRHARAMQWLLGEGGMEASPMFRLSAFLRDGKLPDRPVANGWPWFPGTAAWVTPTCLGILALKKCYWRQPSPDLRERIDQARAFLLSRRCADGGWNHGSARALGYDSDSYPETTGQALLALAGTDPAKLQGSLRLAQRFLREQRSSGGAAWLRLGLLAHQQLPAAAPLFTMPCRTVPDIALTFLAAAAERGCNVFSD